MMSFQSEYKTFIQNTGEIAKIGLQKRNFKGSANTTIQSLRKDVIQELLSDKAVKAVLYATSQISPKTIKFYTRELEFFNDQYQSDPEKNADGAVDDAKTLKESAEKLLGNWLPSWLKDLLEILNELLSLGSSG